MEILEQSYQCLKICLHYSQIAINKRHTFYIVIGFVDLFLNYAKHYLACTGAFPCEACIYI